jgi:tetratricopeptide (TPR) repeat protein
MAATLALGALLPILPITAYNASQGDTVLISSQAGINLWIGNNPHSDGSTAIVPGTRPDWWGGHSDAIRQAELAEGQPLSPSEVSHHYSQRSINWIREAPIAWLGLMWHKTGLLLGHEELGNNANVHFTAHHFSWTMNALPPSFALLFSLGLVGLLLGYKRREVAGELPAFLFVYSLSILAFFVCARFRAPLLPILACGAGHSLSWFIGALRAGRHSSALKLSAAVAVLVLISVRPNAATHKDSAQGFWQLGIAAHQSGDLATAIEHYETALKTEQRYWYAWRDLGKAHLQSGDLVSAERALRRGLSIRPLEPWLSDLLADVLFEAGRPEELKELGEALINAHPAHALSCYHSARGSLLLGEDQEARTHVLAGLRIDPANFQLHQLAARFSSADGKTDEACEHISAALAAATAAHDSGHIKIAHAEAASLGCQLNR